MKRILLIVLAGVVLVVGLLAGGVYLAITLAASTDPFVALYEENCSTCHGENLEGTVMRGSPLVGIDLKYGETVPEISRSIAEGFPTRGMPGWSATLNEAQVQSLAIYIAERRVDRTFTDFKVDMPLVIPEGTIETELHDFRIEIVATGLHPLPFSIAPLPDGRILVTEKTRGLRVISADGELSELVEGVPEVHNDGFEIATLEMGLGWLLDVALHPDYANNGWIYLHYTDRCGDCEGALPVSMNTLVRARIEDGAWVDEETIWRADKAFYSSMPDLGAGGRIAFDDDGYVFISIGIKGQSNYHGIQDLGTPYGKIHRMHDDGRVPADNPFVDVQGAYKTIWSYGHRSPQGLEFDQMTRQLWGTEMGPRGGDELNLLLPGRNYGWPLYSKGVNYDGTKVEYWKNLNIEFDLKDIEQPVVDFTPSPAISSFIFYDGDGFPGWRRNVVVGSLKATELYRVVLEADKLIHTEILLKDLARIRDIETGPDGFIYLLLEHASGAKVVRLVPAESGRQSGP